VIHKWLLFTYFPPQLQQRLDAEIQAKDRCRLEIRDLKTQVTTTRSVATKEIAEAKAEAKKAIDAALASVPATPKGGKSKSVVERKTDTEQELALLKVNTNDLLFLIVPVI
jgi:hypothetical protein